MPSKTSFVLQVHVEFDQSLIVEHSPPPIDSDTHNLMEIKLQGTPSPKLKVKVISVDLHAPICWAKSQVKLTKSICAVMKESKNVMSGDKRHFLTMSYLA